MSKRSGEKTVPKALCAQLDAYWWLPHLTARRVVQVVQQPKSVPK